MAPNLTGYSSISFGSDFKVRGPDTAYPMLPPVLQPKPRVIMLSLALRAAVLATVYLCRLYCGLMSLGMGASGRVGWSGLAVCVWVAGHVPSIPCHAVPRCLSNTFTGHPHCLIILCHHVFFFTHPYVF